jgi:retinol dehydrogenase 12
VTNEMQDKVCLVTGATSGIGRVTAQALADRGATTVLVARDATRGAVTVDDIKRATGNDRVDLLVADLSSQAQIRRLVEEFLRRYSRLDVLVNNAGALFMRRRESVDGIEMTLALNHLAPFLLTNLLLPTLKASAPARIVTVASAAHNGATFNFDDPQQRRGYRGLRVYGESKLANIMFTYELARRLAGTDVTANALHPGFVASNFGKGESWPMRAAMMLVSLFAISPVQGADTSIYLATSEDVAGVSGKYFDKRKPVQSSAASYDEGAARRLWELSTQLTGLTGQTL